MIPSLLILGFLVIVGCLLYIFELRWRRNNASLHNDNSGMASETAENTKQSEQPAAAPEAEVNREKEDSAECCGLHLVCEKDSLSPMSAEILYYDDEELDRFIGRNADSYTPEEVEEFRDVLMTLRPEDVTGWARSITQRRLELPPEVRDELLMLVNEQRK